MIYHIHVVFIIILAMQAKFNLKQKLIHEFTALTNQIQKKS